MAEGISLMKGNGASVLASMQGDVVKQAATRTPKPALSALPNEVPGASMLMPASPLGQISTPAAFPNDVPVEVLRRMIVDLELQRERMTEVIDSLRLLSGDPVVVASTISADAATTQKLLEHEADRRAAEQAAGKPEHAVEMAAVVSVAEARDRKKAMMLTALAAEAAAATTAVPDLTEQTAAFNANFQALKAEAQAAAFTPSASDGWTCPTHGQAVEKVSPRRGTKYQACPAPGCGQFERL